MTHVNSDAVFPTTKRTSYNNTGRPNKPHTSVMRTEQYSGQYRGDLHDAQTRHLHSSLNKGADAADAQPMMQKKSRCRQRSKHGLVLIGDSTQIGHIVQKRQRTVPTTKDSAVRSMNVIKACKNIFNIPLTSLDCKCIVSGSPVAVPRYHVPYYPIGA